MGKDETCSSPTTKITNALDPSLLCHGKVLLWEENHQDKANIIFHCIQSKIQNIMPCLIWRREYGWVKEQILSIYSNHNWHLLASKHLDHYPLSLFPFSALVVCGGDGSEGAAMILRVVKDAIWVNLILVNNSVWRRSPCTWPEVPLLWLKGDQSRQDLANLIVGCLLSKYIVWICGWVVGTFIFGALRLVLELQHICQEGDYLISFIRGCNHSMWHILKS